MIARPDATPRYLRLSDERFAARVDELFERYADCDLCAYDCGVDRTAGETGACQVEDTAYVCSYFDHHGEEDVLRGTNGSGTIFLAHCNMACVFCQNFETSHEATGEPVSPAEIAEMALDLQARGCHNLNFVTRSLISGGAGMCTRCQTSLRSVCRDSNPTTLAVLLA